MPGLPYEVEGVVTPVARQALVIAGCCLAGSLVATAVVLVFMWVTWGSATMGDLDVVAALCLLALWLGLTGLLLAVHNWEEWWKR